MKIFVYAMDKADMPAIRWHFGKAEYIDVTEEYRDILALCADKIIINNDTAPSNVVQIVREFEEDTKEDSATEYIYVTEKDLVSWFEDYFDSLNSITHEVSKSMSTQEFEAFHLWGLQKYHGGIITNVYNSGDGTIKHFEYHREEVKKKELLIISLGNNPIDKDLYVKYKEKYENVSVAWFGEQVAKEMRLRELYEFPCSIDEVPFVLRDIKRELDNKTQRCRYAYWEDEYEVDIDNIVKGSFDTH